MAPFVQLWDAYGRGRLDDALDLIDEACEVQAAGSDRVYRGHDGVRAVLAESRRRWKSVTLTSDEIVEIDDATIVAIARLTAFDHGGEQVVDTVLACVAEFRRGLVVRACSFVSADDALAWISARPALP